MARASWPLGCAQGLQLPICAVAFLKELLPPPPEQFLPCQQSLLTAPGVIKLVALHFIHKMAFSCSHASV